MFDNLKNMILGGSDKSPKKEPINIHVATCALLIEISRIDGEFSAVEHETIIDIMKKMYELSPKETALIIETATEKVDASIDSWKFTNFLNENLSKPDRVLVMEHIWNLVFADGHLDVYETYLTNRLGGLLKLSHKENIAAKQKALKRL